MARGRVTWAGWSQSLTRSVLEGYASWRHTNNNCDVDYTGNLPNGEIDHHGVGVEKQFLSKLIRRYIFTCKFRALQINCYTSHGSLRTATRTVDPPLVRKMRLLYSGIPPELRPAELDQRATSFSYFLSCSRFPWFFRPHLHETAELAFLNKSTEEGGTKFLAAWHGEMKKTDKSRF
jgi:hypothetical protein